MASPPLLPPPPSCMEHMRGKLLLLDTTSASSDSPSSSSSFAVGADAGAASSPVASCSLDDELQTRFVFPSDAKRAKHRILVKRAYHQKLNALSELRKLEKTLQTQYQTLLQRVSVQFEVQVARGEVDFEQGDPTGGLSVLRDLYVRLTRIKDELQKENRALRKLSREHERFHTRLEHVVFADQRTGVLEKQRQQGIDSTYATRVSRWRHCERLEPQSCGAPGELGTRGICQRPHPGTRLGHLALTEVQVGRSSSNTLDAPTHMHTLANHAGKPDNCSRRSRSGILLYVHTGQRISSTHVQMELARSVAIITGAAGGFGKAFADTILADGGKVLITDINTEGVEATAKVLADKYGAKRVSWIRQDVTDTDSFGAAFDHARTHFDDAPVNMLVNNAGIGADLTFYNDGAPTNWSRVVEINFVAVMRGTQVAVDHFKKLLPPGKEGVVVNVASIAGLYAVPLLPEYAAAKAGVVSLTRSLYHLKASHNIRVVALCPGFADTDMGRLAEATLPELTSQQDGLIALSEIVAAFTAIVNEPSNAGRCLRVVHSDRRYMRFDGDEQLFPDIGP
ncbi:15-hydroxyprostaglandin dehydrogenase, partial [Globisporangium splendens]